MTKRVLHTNEDHGILGATGALLLAVGGQAVAFLANLDSVGAIIIAVLTFGGPLLQVALKHRWARKAEEETIASLKRQNEWLDQQRLNAHTQINALSDKVVELSRELRIHKSTPPERQ